MHNWIAYFHEALSSGRRRLCCLEYEQSLSVVDTHKVNSINISSWGHEGPERTHGNTQVAHELLTR